MMWPRSHTCTDGRQEGAFASIGHPNNAHICYELQLQVQPAFLPLLPNLCQLGCPVKPTLIISVPLGWLRLSVNSFDLA